VERGVRFVQLFHAAGTARQHRERPAPPDRRHRPACAALVRDLKNRGLLDDTWSSGEASSAELASARGTSPALRPRSSCPLLLLLAGRRGVKKGITYGATDDYGYNVTENPST